MVKCNVMAEYLKVSKGSLVVFNKGLPGKTGKTEKS